MNSINSRFLSILIAALCMSALGISIVYAGPKNAEKKLLERARGLALIVADENRLNNNDIHFASMDFKMGHASEFVGNTGDPINAFTEMKVEKEAMDRKHVCIKLHPDLKNDGDATQVITIFHELAHGYDKHVWDTARTTGTGDTTFNCYPDLKQGVEYCKSKWKDAQATMSPSEWHAEWQATQWIKKYAPEQVPALQRNYHELKLYQDTFGITSMEYPPAEILLQWLSKEI
jgi:hypothetical protein